MLAYVFWHWRRDSVSAETYRGRIRDFHASLALRRPEGFVESRCYAIPGASWIPEGCPACEDWYLLEDSAALDPLDRGAVAPPHQAAHDTIAGEVAGGMGGLYRLRAGKSVGREPRCALWFSKPAGMSYADLYALLAPATDSGDAALWGRQMVLGPAPEFCLHASEEAVAPGPIEARRVPLETIWP